MLTGWGGAGPGVTVKAHAATARPPRAPSELNAAPGGPGDWAQSPGGRPRLAARPRRRQERGATSARRMPSATVREHGLGRGPGRAGPRRALLVRQPSSTARWRAPRSTRPSARGSWRDVGGRGVGLLALLWVLVPRVAERGRLLAEGGAPRRRARRAARRGSPARWCCRSCRRSGPRGHTERIRWFGVGRRPDAQPDVSTRGAAGLYDAGAVSRPSTSEVGALRVTAASRVRSA